MRVLLVGQSYVVAESRKKLTWLAQSPELELSLIVPASWKHTAFGHYPFQPGPADRGLNIFPIPIYNTGRVFAFAYAPGPLWRAIQTIQPDIFQVEQEPGSLSLLELIILARLRRRRAKVIAFTWENLFYRPPRWRSLLEKFELPQLDHLFVGSTGAEAVFRRKAYRGSLSVVPNVGVDPDHFRPQPAHALRQRLGLGQRFVIGFAGRLVPEKGCLQLLQAFARLSDQCHLLFLGSGPLQRRLEQLAQELGVTARVTLQPAVPHSDVPAYLNSMDCLSLPSYTVPGWREQFGLVLAQAMACGVPVVGSNSGAIPEVVGNAGLIFPEGDVNALAACLRQLQTNPGLRAEFSLKGRERVLAHYTHQRIAEQTYDLYQKLLAQ